MHKPFLVEIELRVVNHPPPKKKKTCFGDYLDLYRHVQTSLENIRLLRAQCIVSFVVFVFFCFFWFLWVLDSLGLRRKPFLEIDGVPVPVECSWSSLTGVLHIYTEMVWLKALLHIFKSWYNFQKMQLIQFWWAFPSNNVVPSKQMAAGFLWKECYMFLKKWCYFQT